MLLLGGTIDAEEAQRARARRPRRRAEGGAREAARELAETLAALPALAVRAIKRSRRRPRPELEDGLDRERALFMEVFATADAAEGVPRSSRSGPPTCPVRAARHG